MRAKSNRLLLALMLPQTAELRNGCTGFAFLETLFTTKILLRPIAFVRLFCETTERQSNQKLNWRCACLPKNNKRAPS